MNTDIITIATYYQPHQAESKKPCHIDENLAVDLTLIRTSVFVVSFPSY